MNWWAQEKMCEFQQQFNYFFSIVRCELKYYLIIYVGKYLEFGLWKKLSKNSTKTISLR